MMETTSSKTASNVILAMGLLVCLWVGAALIAALSQSNWSISGLAGQYMEATGMIKPMHTLVDFYTHIKGIEYLICVAFFVAFPAFYQYVNKTQAKEPLTK
jgi:hypothetical protein